MPQQDGTGPKELGPGKGKGLGPCGNGIKKNLGPEYGLRKTGQGKKWTRRKNTTRKP